MTDKEQENVDPNEIPEGEIPDSEDSASEEAQEPELGGEGFSVGEDISPEALSAQVAELAELLEITQKESEKNLDGWQRAQAEFVNFRKRMEREQERINKEASALVIKRFIDVLDDLDRALLDRPTEGEAAEWASGFELINRKLKTILENEGVETMQAEGEMFDPNLHEAISMEDSPDHESGQIIEVIKQGYLIGERVLRPAMVRVAS